MTSAEVIDISPPSISGKESRYNDRLALLEFIKGRTKPRRNIYFNDWCNEFATSTGILINRNLLPFLERLGYFEGKINTTAKGFHDFLMNPTKYIKMRKDKTHEQIAELMNKNDNQ